jgi:LemA protein
MKKSYMGLIILGSIIGVFVLLFIIGFSYYNRNYNKIVTLEETVKQQWGNVESVYQRRLDLIPNLVNTVKGVADFEKTTLTQVIEARAKATSVNIDANNLNSASFQQFQQAQGQLSSALSKLMVVVEKYPDLKANQNFLELQAQLEGTENRITVERMRYNDTVASYNQFIKRLLIKIIFSREEKPYFKADEAASQAPKVQF